jgi:hypothetical protein
MITRQDLFDQSIEFDKFFNRLYEENNNELRFYIDKAKNIIHNYFMLKVELMSSNYNQCGKQVKVDFNDDFSAETFYRKLLLNWEYLLN